MAIDAGLQECADVRDSGQIREALIKYVLHRHNIRVPMELLDDPSKYVSLELVPRLARLMNPNILYTAQHAGDLRFLWAIVPEPKRIQRMLIDNELTKMSIDFDTDGRPNLREVR